ncbi:flavin-containing monooxygenase [Nocardia nova]|uniref:flavin-containing monooxygenase n=1 Tax=Nocardia nova TaxID=37330 RepID=UPI00340371CC
MTASPNPVPGELDRLERALESANIPSLVATLYQLTGDDRWLADPYRPRRAPQIDNNDSGGLTERARADIRTAAATAVRAWAAGTPAAVPAPTGEQLRQLMSLVAGEPVSADFEPMMAGELGFRPSAPRRPAAVRRPLRVVIIGAGVSGLLAARAMHIAGVDHIVFEKNTEVGGTWWENRYPGCGVDTPSQLYSFSFYGRDWSQHFGKRDEVSRYLRDMAAECVDRSAIRFGCEVTAAEWDDTERLWRITVTESDGSVTTTRADAVITATGQLNRPKLPAIAGAERFRGRLFHSARWPEGLDLAGQRVAVVGSGATAMQIVPAIVGDVESLTVYQRSPHWILPSEDYFRPIDADVHWLNRHLPFYRRWNRFRLAWTFNDRVHPSLRIDPEWNGEGRSINRANDRHRQYFTRYLGEQLAGRPDLIEKTLPGYPPYGKRMLLDNGWFAALREPHVELVTDGVAELTETGVRAADGTERPADIVVMATGFEARRPLYPISVRGRDGVALAEVWGEEDARAYLGIAVPGFPNFFLTYGPNSNLGHGGSFITIAECQVRYIADLVCAMIENGIGTVECRREVHDRYNELLDQAHARMIWTYPGTRNWYRNTAGRVVTNMPWRVADYWRMTEHADLADFTTEAHLSPAPLGGISLRK